MNKILAIIIVIGIIALLYAFIGYIRTKEPIDVFAGAFLIFGFVGLLFASVRMMNEAKA